MTLAVIGLLTGHVASATATQTWAERLGYQPDKRVLILYAAQMGVLFETNKAGRDLLAQELCQSAGVLAACPWFEEAAQWCRNHPDHDIGLSLTLTSEWKDYRWGPVAPRSEVSSLVDGDGYLASSVLQVSLNASAEEVKREIAAQIQKARAAGIRPSHLAPHLGALLARPDLAAIYLDTARKHWIPAVMVELTPEHVARFRAEGVPLNDQMVELVATYPLPKLDDLRFMPRADTLEEKKSAFIELVKSLPPGITQIVIQPAVESEALKAITEDWRQRVWDAKVLTDPDVREFLTTEDLIFTSWKEMMQRFEGRPPADFELESPRERQADKAPRLEKP